MGLGGEMTSVECSGYRGEEKKDAEGELDCGTKVGNNRVSPRDGKKKGKGRKEGR